MKKDYLYVYARKVYSHGYNVPIDSVQEVDNHAQIVNGVLYSYGSRAAWWQMDDDGIYVHVDGACRLSATTKKHIRRFANGYAIDWNNERGAL